MPPILFIYIIMPIVISPKVRVVLTVSDTTNFDYAINKATEISIVRNSLTVSKEDVILTKPTAKVTSTPNKLQYTSIEGDSSVSISFQTYIKPINDAGIITSAEKLLWESITSTSTNDTIIDSTVTFSNSSTTNTIPLYLFLIFEDGTYYKIDNAIVKTANILLDINKVATINWSLIATKISYNTTPLTGTPKTLTNMEYIRNKVSTISISNGQKAYNLALTNGSVTIDNTVRILSRKRLAQPYFLEGIKSIGRNITGTVGLYLNNSSLSSAELIQDLMAYNTLADYNSLLDLSIVIGGTGTTRVNMLMPKAKVSFSTPDTGVVNTIELSLFPQESSIGANDELVLKYKK